MTNFEKITETPEALGEFLTALSVAGGPWEEAFHRTFCDGCREENCDAENCPHNAERENPLWRLTQETNQEADAKAYREELDCVCVGYGVYLGGWNKSRENYLEGIEKVIFPKVSACNPLIPERAELKITFKSMEYADAVIKALDKMLAIEIRVAVQHFNRINRCGDIHGNVYILEATPKEIVAEPLTMSGGTGVEVHFEGSRFSATDGSNERWTIEWQGQKAEAGKEAQK